MMCSGIKVAKWELKSRSKTKKFNARRTSVVQAGVSSNTLFAAVAEGQFIHLIRELNHEVFTKDEV
jgi:hypothetical protein